MGEGGEQRGEGGEHWDKQEQRSGEEVLMRTLSVQVSRGQLTSMPAANLLSLASRTAKCSCGQQAGQRSKVEVGSLSLHKPPDSVQTVRLQG